MKIKWKQLLAVMLAVSIWVIGATVETAQPVLAATKSYVLTEGVTQNVQLDGKGAKEKIKFVVESEENPDKLNRFGKPTYHNSIAVYVNNNIVYETKADTEYSEAIGQVYVTTIDKNDTVRDIFIALTSSTYTGKYLSLDYCRYANGKMKKIQNLKNYLDQTLVKDIADIPEEYKDSYIYYHSMDQIDQSLWATGNKEVILTIDLPGYNNNVDYGTYHADYALKLKNGKLVKRDSVPNGKVHVYYNHESTYEWVNVTGKAVFYTTPGGTKKAFSVKDNSVVFIEEYKYINGVLYLKGERTKKNSFGVIVSSGKTGWIKSSDLNGFVGNHI